MWTTVCSVTKRVSSFCFISRQTEKWGIIEKWEANCQFAIMLFFTPQGTFIRWILRDHLFLTYPALINITFRLSNVLWMPGWRSCCAAHPGFRSRIFLWYLVIIMIQVTLFVIVIFCRQHRAATACGSRWAAGAGYRYSIFSILLLSCQARLDLLLDQLVASSAFIVIADTAVRCAGHCVP